MKFTKMHGAGNDYVFVDLFDQQEPNDLAALAVAVSDRHKGIGSDGLICIARSDRADAEMMMFNADGTPGEMCGNGIRCVAALLREHKHFEAKEMTIASAGRFYPVELGHVLPSGEQVSTVDLGTPALSAEEIPTSLLEPLIDCELLGALPDGASDFAPLHVTPVGFGNPHCVLFVKELDSLNVATLGPWIETHKSFPSRTNVEFVEVLNRSHVRQRTWERGSGETMACGSGAAAVCVAGVLTDRTERSISIKLAGGTLGTNWRETDDHLLLTGPTQIAFKGEWPDD